MKNIPAKITEIIFVLIIVIGFTFVLPAVASDQIPAPPQNRPIALINAEIYTVTKDVIENGTLLFENGKITGVGKNINLPQNTDIIDISGKRVYPRYQ